MRIFASRQCADYRKFQVGCPHNAIVKYELTNCF